MSDEFIPPDGFVDVEDFVPPDGYVEPPKAQLGVVDSLKLAANLVGKDGALETPWSKFSGMFPKAGEALAEGAGKLSSVPIIGKVFSNPSINAIPATAVSMVPDVVSAIGAIKPTAGGITRASEIIQSGKRIGAAEKAAGVITKAADKYPTSGSVGEMLNTLEDQLKGGTLADPQQLQQANDIIRYIWDNPKLVGKTTAITVQSARVSRMIQQALNKAVDAKLTAQGITNLSRTKAAADFATKQRILQPLSTATKWTGRIGAGLGSLEILRRYLQSSRIRQ